MNIKYNKALWLIIILAIVMMIPFLGLSDFNTKGEPREAVVAYTMLEHGNWILPINNGGDIPYKPPFFHWCIAFFSLIAGHVNEYTSRLPSAVSLVLMTIRRLRILCQAQGYTDQPHRCHPHAHRLRGAPCRNKLPCGYGELCPNGGSHVSALPLVEKGKHQLPWLAILCMKRRHADQGSCGHHPAMLRDGRIYAYPARELLGHRMAHGFNRPALAHHPILLVLCRLSARWRRVPATGEGREHRPIHGQDGIRMA